MNINLDRIKTIEAAYADLDPMEAYYRKRSINYKLTGPLVPPTRPLLEQALRDQGHVLDIGCGNGSTLLDCAHLYRAGVGFDESHYILDQARTEAKKRAISNVDFRWGKAIELPFTDETFDFVWTERGPLAQRGIKDLTGLELSAPSLEYARSKAGDLPIQWVEGDVRDFHLNRRYALIFARGCVFDFMLSRTDQEAMLARVHAHLADDGRFMVDTMSKMPGEMVNAPQEFAWFTLNHPNGREIYVSGMDRFDYSKQHWIQTCYERWDKPDGELVRPPNELILRYTMPQDMESLLHYNGFRIVAKYADYDGAPVAEDQPATVFICEKAASQKPVA